MGQAGGIQKVGVGEPEPLRLLVHLLDESLLGAADEFHQRNRCVVADCTMTPCRSSSTDTALRGSMNMREPSTFHAVCDTFTICDGRIAFCAARRRQGTPS